MNMRRMKRRRNTTLESAPSGKRQKQIRGRTSLLFLLILVAGILLLSLSPVHSLTNTAFPITSQHLVFKTSRGITPLFASSSASSSEPSESLDPRQPAQSEATTASSTDNRSPPPAKLKDDDDDNEASVASRIKNSKFLERNQYWIVFVDDEEAIRQSVGDFLYDSGYQVTACADSQAAVQVFSSSSSSSTTTTTTATRIPDCIVSDIRMPGGPDGLELLAYIRKSEQLRRVPVILLTAKGLTADRIAGYKAGADVYLPKPFYPEELLSAIDNAIARQRQMKSGVADLKQEVANIKQLLRNNGRTTVKQTDVYLTPAEREIVELLCQGFTNQEIADQRQTSKNYVTRTLKRIYEKTQTTTRTELLKWAVQTGYVNPKM